LIDPSRRSRYDAGQRVEAKPERPAAGFEGFDFSTRGADYSATFGDLFADVLTERGGRAPAQQRGADLHVEMQVTFEEALTGIQRSIPVTRRENCRACAGTGRTRLSTGSCQLCQGTGAVRSVRGHMVFSRACSGCGGTGQQTPRACEPCAGSGQETRTERVMSRVPAGVADGDRLRIPSKGNAGLHGGAPGDLYITVKVAPHPVFRREGDDLHMVVPIAIHEAALGAKIDVRTLEGTARLRVPPGTQSGQRFRLREHGAPSTRTGERGDLIVDVRIMLPKLLDERSKDLLREFGRINGENVRES
jgi:molecular chaperone DnaJ